MLNVSETIKRIVEITKEICRHSNCEDKACCDCGYDCIKTIGGKYLELFGEED